jgi:hypothetical protein
VTTTVTSFVRIAQNIKYSPHTFINCFPKSHVHIYGTHTSLPYLMFFLLLLIFLFIFVKSHPSNTSHALLNIHLMFCLVSSFFTFYLFIYLFWLSPIPPITKASRVQSLPISPTPTPPFVCLLFCLFLALLLKT